MKLKEELVLRQIGEDYVIVEPEQDMLDFSRVYSLNESAAWLWGELKGKDFTVEDMVQLLLNHYELDFSQEPEVRADAQKLLTVFQENALLVDTN